MSDNDEYEYNLDSINTKLADIREQLKEVARLSGAIWGLGIGISVIIVFGWVTDDVSSSKFWNFLFQPASYENIVIDKKPVDCNFFHAPVGDKDCKYRKVIVNTYFRVENGVTQVSYDDQKTWQPWDGKPNQQTTTHVTWEKVSPDD